jgi:iron complex transport system ATP-binding protein
MHDLNLAAALAHDMVLLARGEVLAAGAPAAVLQDELLSTAYGCPVFTNRTPAGERPFLLPPSVFLAPHAPNGRTAAEGPPVSARPLTLE